MSIDRLTGLCLFALSLPMMGQQPAEANARAQDPGAVCQSLAQKYRAAVAAYWQQREAMLAAGQRPPRPRDALKPMTDRAVAEVHAHAQRHAGKDAAVPFLVFLVEVGGQASTVFTLDEAEHQMVQAAFDALSGPHRESPRIGEVMRVNLYHVGRTYGREARVRAWIDWVAEEHGVPRCRAQALLARGTRRIHSRDEDAGLRDLREVLEVTTDAGLLAKAQQGIGEVERFAVGAVAPEIDGVDMDGVSFRLTDYRGKVVLLDFWGFW